MVSEAEVLKFIQTLGDFSEETIEGLRIFKSNDHIFLTLKPGSNPLRLEVRTDHNLRRLLIEQYESVLPSRSLGTAGLYVVASGQLPGDEILDLIRLSYNLSQA